MKLRIRCELLGCVQEQNFPCCFRCGEDLYADFIQYGRLDPLFRFYWRSVRFVKKFGPRKCTECGKRIVGPGYGYSHDFCSDKCHDNWLPF